MSQQKEHTERLADNDGAADGRFNPRSWHPILSIIVGSVLGSSGGLGVLSLTPLGQEITRPNAYTSIQAEAEHKAIDQRLGRLESHVENHPDTELRAAIGLVVADVAAGKAERKLIIQNQNRILDRLDKQ